MAGKGSKPRPVDPKVYAANFDQIRWHKVPVGTAGPAVRVEQVSPEELRRIINSHPSETWHEAADRAANCPHL